MVSVQQLSSPIFTHKKLNQNNFENTNVVTFNAQNPNLLQDYLSLVAGQNRALISFGKKLEVLNYNNQRPIHPEMVKPAGKNFSVDAFRNGISSYAQWKISTAATRER